MQLATLVEIVKNQQSQTTESAGRKQKQLVIEQSIDWSRRSFDSCLRISKLGMMQQKVQTMQQRKTNFAQKGQQDGRQRRFFAFQTLCSLPGNKRIQSSKRLRKRCQTRSRKPQIEATANLETINKTKNNQCFFLRAYRALRSTQFHDEHFHLEER